MVDGPHGESMKEIKIQEKKIGDLFPTYVVAEAGLNHNGDVAIAKKMIEQAKNSNVDAIKFQTYKTENFLTDNSEYFDFFKNVELSFEEFKELKDFSDNIGITFFSAPFDFDSANYLEKIKTPAFKIASSDFTNIPLVEHISKMKLPMIMSTGLCNLKEVESTLEICNENNNVAILHCVADYPTKPEDCNLNAIPKLKDQFHIPVGFSDNGESTLVDLAAVSLGANIIEKHYTLDKKMDGPDHFFSIEPDDLKQLVSQIRIIEKMRGNGVKKPTPSEVTNVSAIRKSITASVDILKGEKFSTNNLSLKRPATGLDPKFFNSILGKSAKNDIKKNDSLQSNDIA